jgi:hypothetical protein
LNRWTETARPSILAVAALPAVRWRSKIIMTDPLDPATVEGRDRDGRPALLR